MTTDTAPRRGVEPVLIVALVLLLITVAGAIYWGITWLGVSGDQNLSYSRDRDAALAAGEQAVQNFNTMDYQNPQKYFDLWASSSTGDLNKEVGQDRKNQTVLGQLAKAKAVTKATVLEGALTELDDHAGKATVIVALDETVTPAGGKPTDKRARFQGNLQKVGDAWLLSSIGVVPVENSGSGQ
jgi:Mce-associated membrane protein